MKRKDNFKSNRHVDTPEEIERAVRRAVSALRGVGEISIKSVAKQAKRYLNLHPDTIGDRIKAYSPEKRTELGIPELGESKTTPISSLGMRPKTSGAIPKRGNW